MRLPIDRNFTMPHLDSERGPRTGPQVHKMLMNIVCGQRLGVHYLTENSRNTLRPEYAAPARRKRRHPLKHLLIRPVVAIDENRVRLSELPNRV